MMDKKKESLQPWLLLDTPPMSAADNMCLDTILAQLKGEGESQNTLRFLQFNVPRVLVDHHQFVQKEVSVDYCRQNKIDIPDMEFEEFVKPLDLIFEKLKISNSDVYFKIFCNYSAHLMKEFVPGSIDITNCSQKYILGYTYSPICDLIKKCE